jgi:hypothetical protein
MAVVLIVSPLRAERFVGLVAEDIAEVCDRGGDLWERPCGEGLGGRSRLGWPMKDARRQPKRPRSDKPRHRQHPVLADELAELSGGRDECEHIDRRDPALQYLPTQQVFGCGEPTHARNSSNDRIIVILDYPAQRRSSMREPVRYSLSPNTAFGFIGSRRRWRLLPQR